jgi:uracil-DNA glycosylase
VCSRRPRRSGVVEQSGAPPYGRGVPLVYDPGPPAAIADIFARVPGPPAPEDFWGDWGPVFYRGRLDGSARILCVASDPGATERIVGRTLVGDAGQRVQGFLRKLGLTRSYVCLNAFSYALIPSRGKDPEALLEPAEQRAWREELYTAVARAAPLQAIVAFGVNARVAVRLWAGRPAVPLLEIPHPTSHDETQLLARWRTAIDRLRTVVDPDPDGSTAEPNYGDTFTEADYAAIPRADLPFGAPRFLGDDAWARARTPPLRGTVTRPPHDDRHTLIWIAPTAP